MQYEKRILHALLDSYESSSLSRGENKVSVHIAFSFTKKTMPAYFDESSLAYEDIHAAVKHLEELGYVQAVWKGKKENHILQKVILCEDKVEEVYQYIMIILAAAVLGTNKDHFTPNAGFSGTLDGMIGTYDK